MSLIARAKRPGLVSFAVIALSLLAVQMDWITAKTWLLPIFFVLVAYIAVEAIFGGGKTE